jgi:hypothetical protein
MKTIIWKIKYTLEIRKLCGVSLLVGWDMAGSTLEEMFDGDTEECTPKEAAEEERDEWIRCQ